MRVSSIPLDIHLNSNTKQQCRRAYVRAHWIYFNVTFMIMFFSIYSLSFGIENELVCAQKQDQWNSFRKFCFLPLNQNKICEKRRRQSYEKANNDWSNVLSNWSGHLFLISMKNKQKTQPLSDWVCPFSYATLLLSIYDEWNVFFWNDMSMLIWSIYDVAKCIDAFLPPTKMWWCILK